MPIETAHEIAAALADYVGDPAGFAAVGHAAPTVLDDATEAAVSEDVPTTQCTRPPRSRPADPEPTRESAAPVAGPPGATSRRHRGPAPTEAGTPVFYARTAASAWTTGAHRRGLRSDEAGPARPAVRPAAAAARCPEPEQRPLFAPDPPPATGPRRRAATAADPAHRAPPVRAQHRPRQRPLPRDLGPRRGRARAGRTRPTPTS